MALYQSIGEREPELPPRVDKRLEDHQRIRRAHLSCPQKTKQEMTKGKRPRDFSLTLS